MVIIPDRNVPDLIRRSWRERIFSRPWQPFKKYRKVRMAYQVGNTILVSYETYNIIRRPSE